MGRVVMKLLDRSTGEMKCKVCGNIHYANRANPGKFVKKAWTCNNGCKLSDLKKGK